MCVIYVSLVCCFFLNNSLNLFLELVTLPCITSAKEVMFSVQFVSLSARLRKNLLTCFSRNLVEGCSMGPERTNDILEWIRIIGQIQKILVTFTVRVGFGCGLAPPPVQLRRATWVERARRRNMNEEREWRWKP